MNKTEAVSEVVGKIVGLLIFYVLICFGLKYAFDFTWFQAGMVTYMWSFLESSLNKIAKHTK